MRVEELDWEVPEELIAQAPLSERDAARLLVLKNESGLMEHRMVRDLPRLVKPALWVFNTTRVVPARLTGRLMGVREGGIPVEMLLIERLSEQEWLAWAKPARRFREGALLTFGAGQLVAEVKSRRATGEVVVQMRSPDGAIEDAIAHVATLALPPYIKRAAKPEDEDRYQTLFAKEPGAIAAPTAGLHFSARLLDELRAAGHRTASIVLHVGPGTFAPVRVETLSSHAMHREQFEISEQTAQAIAAARSEGRPIVAVGTTVLRALESSLVHSDRGEVQAVRRGSTDLFIYPPYKIRSIDALMTNFHTPQSTLLALVMAWSGVEPIRRAYQAAVRERYRFFSYGDATLLGADWVFGA